MDYTDKQLIELHYLLERLFQNELNADEVSHLQQILMKDNELLKYYFRVVELQSGLNQIKNLEITSPSEEQLKDAFYELAEYEKTASEVVIPEEEPDPGLIQKVVYMKTPRNISKLNLSLAVLSAAALLLIILFIHFAPPAEGVKVAVLSDSMNAKWANTNNKMEKGSSLVTSKDNLLLREGYAELLFDNHAQITIEGPAEFQIAMADQIALRYGRLYANIPSEAIGFTVTTPNSKIIDLGTEFGVETALDHTTELHVLKGRTTLISGDKKNKTSTPVTEGIAKIISGVDGSFSDITCDPTKFARKINSKGYRVWRGENIKLASIIAGRNGFTEVDSLIGLNPATGKYTTSVIRDNRASKQAYNLVDDSEFIDGVFVPDGGAGAFPVSSEGHTFNCTNTAGLFTHEIAVYKGDIESLHSTIPAAVFNGHKYENEPLVVLHSNIGITLDLQAIRASFSGLDLRCFKATGGITETLQDAEGGVPDLDFWILVDGQVRYERKLLKIEDGLIDFNIELHPQDRFLTLIVGDGLRKENGKRDYPYANDFFYLINPELCMTE